MCSTPLLCRNNLPSFKFHFAEINLPVMQQPPFLRHTHLLPQYSRLLLCSVYPENFIPQSKSAFEFPRVQTPCCSGRTRTFFTFFNPKQRALENCKYGRCRAAGGQLSTDIRSASEWTQGLLKGYEHSVEWSKAFQNLLMTLFFDGDSSTGDTVCSTDTEEAGREERKRKAENNDKKKSKNDQPGKKTKQRFCILTVSTNGKHR